jgi:1,4-alpha-glucan branching enzyme
MHDTLEYFAHDPIHRKFHHDRVTFRMLYAFSEAFVLPLSHDEVVHGKGSLLGRMPGDGWQKLANLRLLLAWLFAQPGKKLLFMGGEFGQGREWNHDQSLDWHLLEVPGHRGVQRFARELNRLYREEPALHEQDLAPDGFEWLDCHDAEQSTLTLLRRGRSPDALMAVALNFTPVPRHNFRVGVPRAGYWREVLNSDAREYGGSAQGNLGGRESAPVASHGRFHSLSLTLPPLGAVFLRWEAQR